MRLKDAREAYYDYSARVSESTRLLALAGIGVVWVLRVDNASEAIAVRLLLPLLLFVACLAFHLLHYIAATIVWGALHRRKESELKGDEERDFLAPQWANWPGNTFFVLKVISIIAGYGTLGSYALSLFR